ncbi:MAG: membrane protein insertion efficiency factor YidD [Planctomycetota bacterium]
MPSPPKTHPPSCRQGTSSFITGIPASAAIFLIRVYRTGIAPHLRPVCRFHPTCSEYAIAAIRRYGLIRSIPRTGWRILRCHPFSRGGYDPP